jgi:DNA-binding PadR family transcriptional regulator
MDDQDSLNEYEQKLLEGWEDVFRKAQLTMWILLGLKDGPKHMAVIKEFIAARTNRTISADDKSMYRALRRLHDGELIDFESVTSQAGPDLKLYSLTGTGQQVLQAFLRRNIIDVFYAANNEKLIRE